MGWALTGLLSVAPCPRTVAQDIVGDTLHLDGSDVYCLGENRLRPIGPVRNGQREYRTELERFSRVIAYGMDDNVPSHFQAWGKDHLIYTFGGTADSRQEAFRLRRPTGGDNGQLERESTTTRRTISWNVNLVEDRNGNAMTVAYERREGFEGELWWSEIYPSKIHYAPNREVRFFYEHRPDPIDGFAAGVHSRINQRLRFVDVFGGQEGGPLGYLRGYRLAYRNDSITGHSLLQSVKECDRAGVCLRPLTFEWSLGGYGIETIPTGVPADHNLPAHVLDINGDGKQDLMFFGPDRELMIRRSTGSGLTAAAPSGIPREVTDFSTPRTQIRLADIDGDGRTDAMALVETSSLVYRWKLYRSDGARFVPHPDNIEITEDGVPDPMYLVDLDGNGAPDILTGVHSFTDDGTVTHGRWRYRLNDGTDGGGRFAPEVETAISSFEGERAAVVDEDGDGRQELLTQPIANYDSRTFSLDQSGAFVSRFQNYRAVGAGGDVNGDGLPDQINRSVTEESGPLTLSAVVNSGNGGASGHGTDLSNPPDDRTAIADGDFTGDGRDDVMFFLPGEPSDAFDTAHGPQLYEWRDDRFHRVPVLWPAGYFLSTETRVNSATMMDIDGNGVLDLHLESVIPVIGGIAPSRRILKRTDAIPDRIVRFGDPAYAASVTVDYTTLADRTVHTPGTCAFPTACQVAGGLVVGRHSVATFSSGPPQDTYVHTYEKATTDLQGRGWLGFRKHTVVRPLTQEVTVTTFRESEWNPLVRAYPYAHVPFQVVTSGVDRRTGAVREFDRTVTNTPLTRIYLNLTFRVELDIQEVVERERPQGGSWSVLSRRTTEPSYDEFGNMTLRESKTTGGRRTTERTLFRNHTNSWLLGLRESTEVTGYTTGDALSETRTTRFDYDARGNQTVSIVEPGKPLQKLTTIVEYGPQVGEITSVTRTDGAGRSRGETFEYDADRLHATATVRTVGAIEHRTQVQTHPGLGVPLRTVDVNGVPATMRYDGFGRSREIHRADGSFELTAYAPFLGGQSTVTTRSDGSVDSAIHDQLGRELQRQATTFGGSQAFARTDYNAMGLVSRVSRPRLSSQADAFTTTEYDLRGRATTVTAPDGVVTTHAYVGLRTDTTANGETRVHRNADGDVVLTEQFDRDTTSSFLATRFAYGPFGETTKRTAPDGTASSMVSDTRNRRQETVTDPNRGVTTTFYNAFGDVEEQTRAGNRTTTYIFDGLGRVTEMRSPDGVARNTWDTAPHGIGKLTNARSTDQIVTEYSYDDLGRPATSTTRIDGVGYQTRQTYDLIGRLSTVTYPEIPGAAAAGRLQVVHEYNQFGYLLRVKDAAAGGPVFWTALEVNAAGQLVGERFGNGVVTVNDYQVATGLLTGRAVIGPGAVGTLATVDYLYSNPERHVKRRRAVVTGGSDRSDHYTYDTVGRLLAWDAFSTGQPERVTSYTYDRVGNLDIETTDVGTTRRTIDYTYGQDGAPPHALSARNGARYTYDAAGRQLTGDGRGITYTMADLPRASRGGRASAPTSRTTRAARGSARATPRPPPPMCPGCSSGASPRQRGTRRPRTSTTSWSTAAPSPR